MKYRLRIIFFLLSVLSMNLRAEIVRPNFVLIVTDDQSWAGTSICMDNRVLDRFQDRYETPAVVGCKRRHTFSAGYAAAPCVLHPDILFNGGECGTPWCDGCSEAISRSAQIWSNAGRDEASG